jgi:RNA polymerase sigma factor (sigma-70 family)
MAAADSSQPKDTDTNKAVEGTKAVEAQSNDTPDTKPEKMSRDVKDYVELIETVARVEYSRLPNHLIDHSELVNIGAIAIHVLLTSNPDTEYNITYLSTAMKWAIRNELRHRYKWYSLKTTTQTEETKDNDDDGESGVSRAQVREAVYETILSVDGMMEGENPQELRDDSYTPEEKSELREMARIVKECISRLPDRDRQIVEARFYQNKKMREIGDMFDISPSRTSRVVQSALDKVKRELSRRGYVPDSL